MGWPKFGRKRTSCFTFDELWAEISQPINPHYAAWYLRPGGRGAAQVMARDFYDKFGRPGANLKALVGAVNTALRVDNVKYRSNMQRLQRFSARAGRGHYAAGIAQRGNRARGLQFTPGERQSEYDRAADWVAKCSSTLNGTGSDSKAWKDLRTAIERVVSQDPLTVASLETLQSSAGRIDTEARTATDPADFYGTSALGRHFLPEVFSAARALRTQALANGGQGPINDYAVFTMLGCILAHPFGDGNGRSSRALYACIQIKNGNRFFPAAYEWVQNQLHERNLNAVVNAGVPDYLRPANAATVRRQPARITTPGMINVPIPTDAPDASRRDARGRRIWEIGELE